MLCPDLFVGGDFVEWFEVFRKEGANFGESANEGGLQVDHSIVTVYNSPILAKLAE